MPVTVDPTAATKLGPSPTGEPWLWAATSTEDGPLPTLKYKLATALVFAASLFTFLSSECAKGLGPSCEKAGPVLHTVAGIFAAVSGFILVLALMPRRRPASLAIGLTPSCLVWRAEHKDPSTCTLLPGGISWITRHERGDKSYLAIGLSGEDAEPLSLGAIDNAAAVEALIVKHLSINKEKPS